MTVELRHLRCFVAIAEEGNLTRAAVRLHLTQPAVTRTLRQLETHLGLRLVDRSTHHLELTAAGQVFRARAVTALTAVDDALSPSHAGTWPLRVGHAWSALGDHTTALLRAWEQRHPQIPLELLRIDDRTAGLTTGTVDVAILRDPRAIPGVLTEQLLAENRMAVVAADSPLAQRSSLTLADLASKLIAVSATGNTTAELWPAGARPATTAPLANADDWLATIAAGRAVGVTSSATASISPYPGVTYVPLTGAPPVTVHLAWRQPPSHPAVPELVALARKVIAESSVVAES